MFKKPIGIQKHQETKLLGFNAEALKKSIVAGWRELYANSSEQSWKILYRQISLARNLQILEINTIQGSPDISKEYARMMGRLQALSDLISAIDFYMEELKNAEDETTPLGEKSLFTRPRRTSARVGISL